MPSRVDARVKTGLLELVDAAIGEGWPAVRARTVLELDERRGRRWRSRADSLDDSVPGRAVHGLLPVEIEAIVELFDRFGDIDRSYRKLAHRGSHEGLVWVSESSVYRTLAAHGPNTGGTRSGTATVAVRRRCRRAGLRRCWVDLY